MCITIPAQVTSIEEPRGRSRPATVVFPGDRPQPVDLAMVPSARVGDYVIVHSGYAITHLEPGMARETLALLGSRVRLAEHATDPESTTEHFDTSNQPREEK